MSTTATIICPCCGKRVKLIEFGNGYMAICCDRVIYNECELPTDDKEHVMAGLSDRQKR
jgi:hypothetical protein